ncbi:hypothetical protein COCCADRAFT_37035 [Bipolaris zeicola 26-R-13]|uniref:non-specific serine/threonine protein kinase n=1 Tax=Cochliobolus carbonum (strain 26-R-13) TaxID=930089 RepID=W6YC20_COCC2|nr:uncharacterized protein COCCADRAFT_37035 [Bipolaris zeicola 26-R-13]EUC33094.1 hypothetical protein COCCADRAFT_37035 [Bipolaris zeicola 26-R-13]
MAPPKPAPASSAVPSSTPNTPHLPLRCGTCKSPLADPDKKRKGDGYYKHCKTCRDKLSVSRQQRRDGAHKRKASDTAPNVPNQKPRTSKPTQKCPGCGSQIEKTTGCDHMTCKCGFEFCYVCRAPYAGPRGIRMIMARKNKNNPRVPPWVTPKPYFKHAARAFKDAHRPHWTPKTIWDGDQLTRDYYSARKGKDKLYGLPPGRDIIPENPYNVQDATHARVHKTLPLRRDARGNPIPPAPAAPPLPLPQPRPRNNYPYDFWPQEPWHPDPIDEARDMTMKFPCQWPVRDETDMRGAKWLGHGSYGCAGLWCQVDPTNVIQRRFVIKEARMNKGDWRDPLNWRDQIPREIRIHQLVDNNRANDVYGHGTIIEHYGYRLMMRQRRYRIYLAYYEGGNLYSALCDRMPDLELMNLFSPPPTLESKDPEGYHWDVKLRCYRAPDVKLPPILPERLICDIIDSLAKACQILHFGQVDYELMAPGAKRITHRDIKPDNIFISPSATKAEFPTFVLADLGLAFYSHERVEDDDLNYGDRAPPDNPDQYTWSNERFDHRYAPELYEKTQEKNPYPIAFLGLLPDYISRPERCPPIEGHIINDRFDYEAHPTLLRYVPALVKLCARCVNWDPHDRPSLLDIREELTQILDADLNMSVDRDYGPLMPSEEKEFIIGQHYPYYPQGGL